MFTSLTSQSGLPTEAVEAQRAIKGLAAATKTKHIHLRPQRDRMQATYSNPKPAHKNSRKNGSVQEPHQAFWSAPPLNYSDTPPQHLWRRVILRGRVSCCGRIVSSFTLSLFSCRNWHCFIVLLGQTVVQWRTGDGTARCSPVGEGGPGRAAPGRWTVCWSQVTQGGLSQRINRRMTPCLLQPFPLSSRSRPYRALLPKNGPLEQLISEWSVMSLHKHGTKIGRTVTYFVVFWCGADGSARKYSRFMARENAPATLCRRREKTAENKHQHSAT